jgi:hypothetical protein
MRNYCRKMNIRQGEVEFEMSFAKYLVIMYYAKQMNEVKASNLFDVTDIEYRYWSRRNLPFEDTSIEYFQARYDQSALQEAITFLGEVIMALNQEGSSDLMDDKYEGEEAFEAAMFAEQGFLKEINFIRQEDNYRADILVYDAIILKEALEFVLSNNNNLPYLVITG